MKKVKLIIKRVNIFNTINIYLLLSICFLFLYFPVLGAQIDNISKFASEVNTAWAGLKGIIEVFYTASLVFGAGYIIPILVQVDNISEVASEVNTAWAGLKTIIEVFYTASLVLGGGYVIWAFSSKKQDASNYLIFWVVGLVVYFILKALFF